ncbi:hypothetical protein ANN_19681 [Periplaneta americana]|uniref:Uncharacterized protein n=1 Tax=Periplaneta americana TaxID=6978 RepID=A0ABQ8SB76_PERAM|nr:hypothetical protein ANN_19681 [Periplaneta americana]
MAGLSEGGNELWSGVQHRYDPAFADIGLRKTPEKSQSGNLSRPGIKPGPSDFAARRANRYSTNMDAVVYETRNFPAQQQFNPVAERHKTWLPSVIVLVSRLPKILQKIHPLEPYSGATCQMARLLQPCSGCLTRSLTTPLQGVNSAKVSSKNYIPTLLHQKEKKKLVGSLAEKKLPTERCSGKNGEREKISRQKKISDDRRH